MSSRARRLRLFVALELPAEVCEELAGWTREALGDVAAELRGAAAVAPARSRSERRPRARSAPRVLAAESLHLTLCFLGSRPPAELPALSEALAAAADRCSLGSVSLGAPVWLPPRRPHALAVAVHDEDGRLAALQRAVTDELARASAWQPERRRWRPHVTVARLRGGEREQPLAATPRLSFVPSALVLYRSHLDPHGARYDALAAQEPAAA